MNLLDVNDPRGSYPPSWYAETATPLAPFPALEGDTRADVCVIGGGFTGLSAALHLAEAGFDVVLIEAQRVGFGASGRNGGQVGSGQRQDQGWLERHAPGEARALWEIAEGAKVLVGDVMARHGIDAGYRAGVIHAERSAKGATRASEYARRLARDYGYEQAEPLEREAIRAIVGSGAFAGGVLDHGAGHLHPLRLALGLARAAVASGVRLYENSRALELSRGARHNVRCSGGTVNAEHVVLACNGYLGDLAPHTAARVMPINNFIIATAPLGARADTVLARDVAVADDQFVVNYWRLSEDRRLLFGGGESYGYRFPRDIAAVVRKPMLAIYPQLRDVEITHAWGGTLAITLNRMPHFSRSGGVYTASGYSGHGIAMAVMAGRMIAAALGGDVGQFDTMARIPTRAFPGGTLLRSPLLALAMTWYGLRDRLGL